MKLAFSIVKTLIFTYFFHNSDTFFTHYIYILKAHEILFKCSFVIRACDKCHFLPRVISTSSTVSEIPFWISSFVFKRRCISLSIIGNTWSIANDEWLLPFPWFHQRNPNCSFDLSGHLLEYTFAPSSNSLYSLIPKPLGSS